MSGSYALFSSENHSGAVTINMFGVLITACLAPVALGIIVTDSPPTSTEYNYSYNVVDPHTGDTKSLHEVRRGDVVTGSYTVLDPDGTRRVVEYTADSRRGFKAVVHSEPLVIPFHRTLTNSHYVPTGNTRYLNQYYSSHTLYREHPLTQSYVAKPLHGQSRLKNKNAASNKRTNYFTPANEINTKTVMFKHGQFFEPNN